MWVKGHYLSRKFGLEAAFCAAAIMRFLIRLNVGLQCCGLVCSRLQRMSAFRPFAPTLHVNSSARPFFMQPHYNLALRVCGHWHIA